MSIPVSQRPPYSPAYDPNALPVEYQILDSGIGYVRVNSNYDDLNLIKRLFERALSTFESNQLAGIIIDMRLNFGGSPLDLAGFLTEEKIPLGQLEYYSDQTGNFEAGRAAQHAAAQHETVQLPQNGAAGGPVLLQRL